MVRHGQTTWNREHRIQGQLDPPLDDAGRRQARLLGERLRGRKFAGFYASDLRRAFETAELLADAIGGPRPTPATSLREIYLGDWEGLRTDEIAERYPDAWSQWVKEPNWDLVSGGEGSSAFGARINAAVDEISEKHAHSDVLVVTHGGVIQVALHRIVGKPSQGLFPFKIQNASISLLERRDGRTVIGSVNDIGHLEPASISEVGPG